jgi:DMSO/TMAO reductase YedYZ molybdopterin-dependent catalytic subunit
MFDALHPQTILAYGMNGLDLPIPHGALVREWKVNWATRA